MQPVTGVLSHLSQTMYGLRAEKYMSTTGTLKELEPSAHLLQVL
jgi:hypothetical protein